MVYKPISAYAAIGNMRTIALVGQDGSIDWCCYPNLDNESIYAAILDDAKGGRFKISPEGIKLGEQRYIENSNVVRTQFQTEEGTFLLTDFMPMLGNSLEADKNRAGQEIHRLLECTKGKVNVNVEWAPKFNYAKTSTQIKKSGECWVATDGNSIISIGGVKNAKLSDKKISPILTAKFVMQEKEKRVIVTKWAAKAVDCTVLQSENALNQTVRNWRNWLNLPRIGQAESWANKWFPLLVRSALTLKLLTHIDTGAIAAAATTSLPEWIGGQMNWDYRYSWLRDAALTTQALVTLGHETDAVEFLEWVEDNHERHFEKEGRLHVMYTLHSEVETNEEELYHLEGHKKSSPIRIGNRAFNQTQNGIFGEVFSIAYELLRRKIKLSREIMKFLERVADYACDTWKDPDHGIWELPEKRHYVDSKIMIWSALDRALHIAEQYCLKGDVERWSKVREEIHQDVLNNGYNEKLGTFVQSYNSEIVDAANLRIPLVEFLPIEDERVQNTINYVMKTLMVNGHVYRFNDPVEHPVNEDAIKLPRKEGAFNICTFWLIDVLALSGRIKEARRIYGNIISCANHVGLFSEEIDPRNREFLGNFPQAFTHIGLINSALYLAYAEKRMQPKFAIVGTKEHQEELQKKTSNRKNA